MKHHISIAAMLSFLVGAGGLSVLGQDDHDDNHRPATQHADSHDHDAHNHDHDAHDDHGAHDDHDHDEHHHDEGGEAHRDEVTLTAEAIRRQNITVAHVAARVLTPTFVAPGRVAFDAEAMAHVGIPVRGRVVALPARAGDAVEAGAELLIVESPELGDIQNEFLQRRTAVSVAAATLEPVRRAHERARELLERDGGISLAEVQRREAELRAAEGALVIAKSSAAAAENRLQLLGMKAPDIEQLASAGEIKPLYTVRAPLAGRVVEREVTQGELVSPDDEALFVIADLSSVWIVADLSERQIAQISIGTQARVRLASAPEVIEGKVGYISASVDPTTRTGQARIAVPNAQGQLRPGMFARVDIAAGGAAAGEPVLAVPEEAVQVIEGRKVVFVPVAGEANTFAARTVTVGSPVGGYVPVSTGLRDGDAYVATGSFILKADLGKSGAAHEH